MVSGPDCDTWKNVIQSLIGLMYLSNVIQQCIHIASNKNFQMNLCPTQRVIFADTKYAPFGNVYELFPTCCQRLISYTTLNKSRVISQLKSFDLTMFSRDKCFLVKEKTDCISSMRAVFVISKLFACNLFYLPPNRSSNEPIQMKTIDYVVALLYVVLYVVFVFPFFGEMVFERTNSVLPSGNVVIIYLVRIIFYFILMANFSSYIMETVNRTKIWRLFTMLYDFDKEVRLQNVTLTLIWIKIWFVLQANRLGIKVVNNNMVFVIYVSRLLIMQVTIIMICAAMTYFHVDQYWLYLQFYFSYTMMDGCYTTTFCIYNYFVFRFRDRFVNINEALR